jgi:hypothetical protein
MKKRGRGYARGEFEGIRGCEILLRKIEGGFPAKIMLVVFEVVDGV